MLDFRLCLGFRLARFGRSGCGGTIAFRRANGWASVTNFGAEPAELPAGNILLVSGPLTDAGRLPQDTTAWIALG